MAGETFAYFLFEDPLTTELPTPLANDRIAVARGPAGSETTYWMALGSVPLASYVYAEPTDGATETAVEGQVKYQFNPAGALATLNVVLPPNPVDGATFQIRSSRDISTLNVTSGGASVNGSGYVLAGGGSVEYLYVQSVNTWFVG